MKEKGKRERERERERKREEQVGPNSPFLSPLPSAGTFMINDYYSPSSSIASLSLNRWMIIIVAVHPKTCGLVGVER